MPELDSKTQKINIGRIKYLNCLPYYFGWEADALVQFESGTPAQINQMMRSGQIDAAPISSMEYLQRPEEYLLFPDLGIASREHVRSVTLFSKKKIEDLNDASIAVTEESLTSTCLLELFLKEKLKITAKFQAMPSNPKVMLEAHDAALLIGNDALFAQPRKWIYRYDLGNLWWQWQGLPFVYAVWAVRKNSPDSGRNFYHALKERFLYNKAHLSDCIQKQSTIGEYDRFYPKVYGYLNNLVYSLDDACWQGLKKFAELAEVHGLCGKPDWHLLNIGSAPVAQPQ